MHRSIPGSEIRNTISRKMEQYIQQTMTEYPDTQLIVFPELATSGYEGTVEQFQALAETTEDGESIHRIGTLAAKYGIYIVYGFPERDMIHTDVLYNSAVLIDKDGKPMGTYRKVHPFASEKTWCRAGCEFPVFDTDLGRLGIMICWDTAFPEVARIYGLKGADLLIRKHQLGGSIPKKNGILLKSTPTKRTGI